MKVGDMVKATDGHPPYIGMLGVVTKVVLLNPPAGSDSGSVANIFWNDGNHQSFVSTKYLEVVNK